MFGARFEGLSGVRVTGKTGKSGVSGEVGVLWVGGILKIYIYSTRARTYNLQKFPHAFSCIFMHTEIART